MSEKKLIYSISVKFFYFDSALFPKYFEWLTDFKTEYKIIQMILWSLNIEIANYLLFPKRYDEFVWLKIHWIQPCVPLQ